MHGVWTLLFLSLLFTGCSPITTSFSEGVVSDLRLEMADLRHRVAESELDLRLSEDRLESNEQKVRSLETATLKQLSKKMGDLEKSVGQMEQDVKGVLSSMQKTHLSLAGYQDKMALLDQKLEEIGKLRSAISKLSQTASAPPRSSSFSSYRVKAGDSLQKIAKEHRLSLEELKRINHLTSDTIKPGQELKLPSPP
ncbi:MAG: LysM peptidoglycan-binding domain-containing protein [Candidatus Rhabdochlamydia sp.]